MELAFLGTGMMGRPMVENLLDDGDEVRVWNRTAARDHEARARLVELLQARFREAIDHGRGDMDWTAIAAEVREEAGLSS